MPADLQNDANFEVDRMAPELSGRVFAITGAASGIGLATAKALVALGAKVGIADVSPELEQAAIDIAKHAGLPQDECVLAQKVDVRDLAQVQAWTDAIVQKWSRLDGAANVAGVFDYPTAALWHEERGIDVWEKVIGVNLTGTANCLHAQLGHMSSAAAKAGKWRNAIVNVSSVAGITARGGSPSYVASKHGLIGLTKAVAKEYGSVGININAIAPGAIDTPMNQRVGEENVNRLVSGLPIPRRGTAEEVAKLILFLLSDDATYVTGATYTIDGGMTT